MLHCEQAQYDTNTVSNVQRKKPKRNFRTNLGSRKGTKIQLAICYIVAWLFKNYKMLKHQRRT